jgi:DNA-binding CsgD family transcriptional regulator
VRYLAAAGQAALAKYANREAAGYLQAALDQVERLPEPTGLPSVASLCDDLARARQRLGETDPARLLLERARARAERDGDLPHVAALARRLGLLEFWCGNFADALRHYETGVAAAQAAGARDTLARLRLTQGSLLLALGHRDEARLRVEEALHIAEAAGDAALLARVHRALLLLHAWTGPPEQGREHGRRAAALAAASGQRAVEWSVHWGLAMLEGLTGNAHAAAHHLAESERIADELRSPLLRLWSAEVAIEYRSGVGDFAASLAVAEPAIASARAFGLRTLLPRLLVWTGNVYLQRGDEERARALLTEAWELSRAGDARRQPLDVHTVVPAYTGMALLYNLTHEHARAREMGEAGLAVADRTGFVAWSVYRLLPALIEATLYLGDLDASVTYAARLRRDSSTLGHPLGLAWANAADALIEFRRGREAEAAPRLQAAVAQLEAVPYPFDAARLRRMAALALVSAGDVDGAARELRLAHDVFARLGAERELAGTRERLRELGVRPPARGTSTGVAGLTGRELDIARLVGERRSNKEIGAALRISPRTVSTHLSNIFAKLDVGSRGELVDRLRAERVLEG